MVRFNPVMLIHAVATVERTTGRPDSIKRRFRRAQNSF
jgi:hypothetical protein